MLIPVSDLYPNILQGTTLIPKTDGEAVAKNILMQFSKEPWFEELFQDVVINQRKTYTIKCRYPIDATLYPSLFEGYQLKYAWEGKCTKNENIYTAAENFREKYWREQWFYSVDVSENEKTLEVTLKSWLNLHNRLDYFENFPVRYGLLPAEVEEDPKNVIP